MNLPSVYNPRDVEARWYPEWESRNFFVPRADAKKSPFTIVIPPPNITGILHMGHALNNTLQDVLIRFRRMQGHAALWVPGTDHAGIATQNVVERQLAKEGLTRQALGREEFVKRVWAWREQYGSAIVQQLRRLGASCDWSRERFTMDEGLSKAVETAFLKLHEAGLIYRGYYLVNWCPRCQTALSDEEVLHEEIQGHLWYILYPFVRTSYGVQRKEQESQALERSAHDAVRSTQYGIVVATTRPETMLGDVAVAVHPKDDRYHSQIGVELKLPLTERRIPVIADEAVDQKFGTGAVKITPAHDINDFELSKRHVDRLIPIKGGDWTSIPIRMMTADARIAELADIPGEYIGLDRFDCRKRIVKDLEKEGLLVKTEEYKTSIGHCYRCKTIIEPYLSPQWFVKMAPLAKLGIEAVEKDGMKFFPQRWTKVYLDWLSNIRDWCISRQIWWGHRIPIWYCGKCNRPKDQGRGKWVDGKYMEPGMVVMSEAEFKKSPPPCPSCGEKVNWLRDNDVLDTWFSSWLWPFSTLGWPEATADLKKFYPTSVLVTAQDIIFFWVARMVMAGKFFMGKIPFQDVYIHGIIRVEGGKKMSKSLGNIIDPLEVIEKMGTDALRFSIAHMSSEGQDMYLSESKFLLGRNFANKLWNASRLILEKVGSDLEEPIPFNPRFLSLSDRWILSRLQQTVRGVTESLTGHRFNEAAKRLYQFLWREFCDWYLEISKLQHEENDAARIHNTHHVLMSVLETTLRLLHPFMPFITEELWHRVRGAKDSASTIMLAEWPQAEEAWLDPEAEESFEKLQQVISEVRNIRATFRVPIQQKVALMVQAPGRVPLLQAHERIIQRLGGVDRLSVHPKVKRPFGSAVAHLGDWDLIVPLKELVDLKKEHQRIEREVKNLQGRAQAKQSRLNNPSFRSKAPAEVVAEEEESLRELEGQLSKWNQSLKQIEQ